MDNSIKAPEDYNWIKLHGSDIWHLFKKDDFYDDVTVCDIKPHANIQYRSGIIGEWTTICRKCLSVLNPQPQFTPNTKVV